MYLTAKELKETLKDLPDDALILYQRIDDIYFDLHKWETESIRWEENELCEYRQAFSAYQRVDKKGEKGLIINAHYEYETTDRRFKEKLISIY